ncbi:hypothetical protein MRX96_036439 [Rhipicephalus microplus]
MRLIHAFEGTDDELLDQAVTCPYASATSASFTTQLVASPFRTNFVPLIRSLPSPRNMDPRLHQGRRESRVEALERTYAHKNTTYYVDAANYDHANNKAVATVVDHTLTERTSASVRCRNITDAEETAIALALALGYRQRRHDDDAHPCSQAVRQPPPIRSIHVFSTPLSLVVPLRVFVFPRPQAVPFATRSASDEAKAHQWGTVIIPYCARVLGPPRFPSIEGCLQRLRASASED